MRAHLTQVREDGEAPQGKRSSGVKHS
jgi:hypothetical protein